MNSYLLKYYQNNLYYDHPIWINYTMFITIRTCCLFPCRKKYHNDSRCIIVLLFHNCVGMDAVFGLVWYCFRSYHFCRGYILLLVFILVRFLKSKACLIIYIHCLDTYACYRMLTILMIPIVIVRVGSCIVWCTELCRRSLRRQYTTGVRFLGTIWSCVNRLCCY